MLLAGALFLIQLGQGASATQTDPAHFRLVPRTQDTGTSHGIPGLLASDLSLREGTLVRERAGRIETLDCTLEGGTGAPLALERTPGGTIFLAAQRGLFTLSQEVQHFDPVLLIDGAPQGTPVGIVAGLDERLWIATADHFGCLETRQYFGRTFGEGDGLPAGPYTALVSDGAGGLLLETPNGRFQYRPGQTPAPQVTGVHVNGEPYLKGRVIQQQHKAPLTVRAQGVAGGGASFRYRMQGHHVWHPLDSSAAALSRLEPGKHTVLISAWDRDLRRSEPEAIQVLVHYPAILDTRTLPLILLGGCGVLLLGFLLRARSIGGGFVRYRRAVVSCILLVLVALQVLVGLVFPHGRSWPFVGFTMYTQSYAKDQLTYNRKFYVLRRDGKLRQLPQLRGRYNQDQLRRALVPVIAGTPAVREQFLKLVDGQLESDYTGFLVLDHRVRLTAKGPIQVAPIVQCAFPPELFHDR